MILFLWLDESVLNLSYICHSSGFFDLIETIIDDREVSHVVVEYSDFTFVSLN